MELLLDHEVDEARAYAESPLQENIPACGHQRNLALVCAKALFCHTSDAGWSVVWPAVTRDPAFGRKLMESVANGPYSAHEGPLTRLSAEQLSELYVWLSQEYPPSKDPKSSRVVTGGTRAFLGYWRQSVLKRLCDLGTPEALQALRSLIDRLPDQADQLKWSYAILRDRVHSASWQPWEPREFLALISDRHKRLVRSEAQLLDVVIESLGRFQEKLHNEPYLLYGLWNEYTVDKDGQKGPAKKGKSTHNPKEEQQLSDAIAGHLRDDLRARGIIANREVEIRRGEETDVHVNAIARGEREPGFRIITAIIEVKGCWNDGVMSDMQTQLVERYLQDNNCQHGLYVVGWFHCDKWDKGDYRQKKPNQDIAQMSKEAAQNMLTAQAEQLSGTAAVAVRTLVLDTALR